MISLVCQADSSSGPVPHVAVGAAPAAAPPPHRCIEISFLWSWHRTGALTAPLHCITGMVCPNSGDRNLLKNLSSNIHKLYDQPFRSQRTARSYFLHMQVFFHAVRNTHIHRTLTELSAMQLGLLFWSGKQLLSELSFYHASGSLLVGVWVFEVWVQRVYTYLSLTIIRHDCNEFYLYLPT